jgi:transcriptional regulator with XRE-family HTH domain
VRNIGKNIKFFRKSAGLSQEKLANKIDLTLRYFQRLESGSHTPTIATLMKIAKALGRSVKSFF